MIENGTSIGAWTVLDKLGAGDFGSAWQAHDSDGTDGVVKLCLDDRVPTRQRFQNEIDVLAQVRHEAIPRLLDSGEIETHPYFVMSLAPGETVQKHVNARLAQGAFFGDVEALRVGFELLRCLQYLHGEGWVHRDIKDANVLALLDNSGGDPTVSLIDFGFCKRHGTTDASTTDSFWRVGAGRYSPPAKLANPAHAHRSHDVFAVGVLLHFMLTGQYPWSTGVGGDIGQLRALMTTVQPHPARELNPAVRREVSDLILDLLGLDDEGRPGAEDAAGRCLTVLNELATATPASHLAPVLLRFPKVIRDPLYGDVRLTEFERDVMSAPELQRLRRIRQLGLTSLVYPGAEHTRFAHSLGCIFKVEQILRSIEDAEGIRIDQETRLTARLYALVHDVTHIAFGHTLEDEFSFFPGHDDNEPRLQRLVLNPTSALGELLTTNRIGRNVRTLLEPTGSIHRRSSVRELVAGPTGADVLDYIDRDAFHCGLDHRVDSAIYRQFRLHTSGADGSLHLVSLLYGGHGVRLDREFAVENLLRERYALFLKVYTHRRKIAASALLAKSLALSHREDPQEMPETAIEAMGDDLLLDRLAHGSSSASAELARQLLRRELPAVVDIQPALPDQVVSHEQYLDRINELGERGLLTSEGRLDFEDRLGRRANVDPAKVIVYCPPTAPGYKRVQHWTSQTPGRAVIMNPLRTPIHLIAQRHLALWRIAVFCVKPGEDEVARLQRALREETWLYPSQHENGTLF